jgi:hypothetical protein
VSDWYTEVVNLTLERFDRLIEAIDNLAAAITPSEEKEAEE